MSFASLDFLIFFSVVLVVVLFLQRLKNTLYKELFFLAASYFFYGYWDWRFCFLLLFVTVASYITARFAHKKLAFQLALLYHLLFLVFLNISIFSLKVLNRLLIEILVHFQLYFLLEYRFTRFKH